MGVSKAQRNEVTVTRRPGEENLRIQAAAEKTC